MQSASVIMLGSTPLPEMVYLLTSLTACGCLALLVLTAIGLAIWSPERFKTAAGGAAVGFVGLAGICGTVMVKALSLADQVKLAGK